MIVLCLGRRRHSLLLWIDDPLLESLPSLNSPLDQLQAQVRSQGHAMSAWSGGGLYLLDAIPTAEGLARHWFERLAPRVDVRSDGSAKLNQVHVWETPHCRATYPVSDDQP